MISGFNPPALTRGMAVGSGPRSNTHLSARKSERQAAQAGRGRTWLLREAIAAISQKYFDGRPVLVAGARRCLDERIEELRSSARARKEPQPQFTVAVDPDQVVRVVEALVVRTEAEVLKRLDQREAAYKLRRQHATAVAERRISLCASRAGTT